MRDTPIDRLIRDSLSADARSHESFCLDENLMTAYLESRLTSRETGEFEAHVADCEKCQRIMAMSIQLQAREDKDLDSKIPAPSRKTIFRISIPIPAIGALIVIAISASLFFRIPNHTDKVAVEKSAALRPQMAPAVPDPAMAPPMELQKAPPESVIHENKTKAEVFGREANQLPSAVGTPLAESWSPSGPNSGAGMDLQKNTDNSAAGSTLPAASPPPPPGVADALSATRKELPAIPLETSPIKTMADSSVPLLSAAAGADNYVQAKHDEGAVASAVQDESSGAVLPARTQQPFARPGIYAASNRIATSMYETGSLESTLRFVIRNLNSNLTAAESKSIGGKVFYKNLGYWVDTQCTEHVEDPIVEIKPAAPEYISIQQKYMGLQPPAIIYWDNRNYVLVK